MELDEIYLDTLGGCTAYTTRMEAVGLQLYTWIFWDCGGAWASVWLLMGPLEGAQPALKS